MVALSPEKPSDIWEIDLDAIKGIDKELALLPPATGATECIFTPGLMTRKTFAYAGTRVRTKIHKTEHQFVILQGASLVSENGEPAILMVAPHHGITKAGTWRQLFVLMDTIWITMHPTDKTTVEEVESDIIKQEAKQ